MAMDFFKRNYEEFFEKIDSNKLVLCVLAITVVTFSPIFLGSDFLAYDDNWYIYENKNVINFSWNSIKNMFSSPLEGQYSPLGEVYNALLYYLFGENATAFKIVALVVHLLNVFLLFNIMKGVFKDKLLVCVISLFFAIHPMQAEAIGWLSVMFRNTVFFMFLGYFFYLKYLEHNFEKYRLVPVVMCYILAFLIKEQAVLFPIGLLLINLSKFDYKWNKRIIVEMAFWGVLTLVFGLITIQMTQTGGPSVIHRDVGVFRKIEMICKTIFDYGYHFLVPFKLSFLYPYPSSKEHISLFVLVLTFVFLGLGVFLSIKNRIFRFGFIWAFGFLSLSLVFSIFHLRNIYMADRYAYVAIIGFSILLYSLLFYVRKLTQSHNLYLGIILLFGVSFAILTFSRIAVFKNDISVWSNAISVNPQNQYAHYNLGIAYGKKKRMDLAEQYFTEAITINPLFKEAYRNRAVVARETKNEELLMADLKSMINFEPKTSYYRIKLIELLYEQKEYSEVIVEANKLLKLDTTNTLVNSYIGRSFFYLNKYDYSIPYLTKMIESDGKNGYYYYLRSICNYQTKNLTEALKDISRAQKLGYKVDKNYLDMIISEARRRSK